MSSSEYLQKMESLKKNTLPGLEKKFGANSYFFGEKIIPQVPLICSSGSLSLDLALCIGGFPEGRIIEIGGQESSGKSTLTLINIAECQRNEKVCAYLDVEQSFDPVYAARLGVDVKNLLVLQPETMEETFEILFDLLNSKVISYIVVDSTNAMIPKKMLEGDTDTALMGKSALLMSQQLPKVVSLASTNSCTVCFLSQIRSKIGVVYGDPTKIGVGEAMKFYASVRIKTSKSEVVKNEDEGQSSIDVVMNVIKNKVGVPFRKAQFTLLTGLEGKYGIDTIKEIIDFGIKYEFITKSGSWYSLGEERIGQGIANVKKFFEDRPEILNDIKMSVIERITEERKKALSIPDSFVNKIEDAVEAKPKRRNKKDEVAEGSTVVEVNIHESEENSESEN